MQPSLGPILSATVAVPDLDRAAAAYRALLGHVELASGGGEEGAWCLLGPPGATWGAVRLLEAPRAPLQPVFRTLGWAAIEILVADADETHASCLGVDGFEVLQAPGGVGGGSALRALQARGPGGEGVYLTQVMHPSEQFHLPSLAAGEHRVYVVVAGTHDVEGVRAFFRERFGVEHRTDHGLAVRVLNQAYGLPPGTLHRLSTLQLAGPTIIEIDEYPAAAVPRPPGAAGIRHVTFAGSDGARVEGRWLSAGDGLEIEVVEAPAETAT